MDQLSGEREWRKFVNPDNVREKFFLYLPEEVLEGNSFRVLTEIVKSIVHVVNFIIVMKIKIVKLYVQLH